MTRSNNFAGPCFQAGDHAVPAGYKTAAGFSEQMWRDRILYLLASPWTAIPLRAQPVATCCA